MTNKRILGVDPGSRVTGYGVIEENDGKIIPIAYGILNLNAKKRFSDRLLEIFSGLDRVINNYRPNEAAFEKIFFAKNALSVLKLGQARGSAMVSAAKNNLSVFEYSPTQIKQALVGYGRSSKEQIQRMVKVLLAIREDLALDASDALAVAICHLNSHKMNKIREDNDWPVAR